MHLTSTKERSTRVLVGLVATLTACTLVTAGTVVAAPRKPKTGTSEQAVDRQTIAWRTGKANRVATTSTNWTVLPMPAGGCNLDDECVSSSFPGLLIPSKGEISLTFSGNFSRAPVELRVKDAGRVMRPGAAEFRPRPGGKSFSFTFVSDRQHITRQCEQVTFQWRSPTGEQVLLNKATIVVHYKHAEPDESIACL